MERIKRMERKTVLIRNLVQKLCNPQQEPLARYQTSYAYEFSEISERLCFQGWQTPREFLAREDRGFYKALSVFEQTSSSSSIENNKDSNNMPYFIRTETIGFLDDYFLSDDYTFNKNIVLVGPKGSGKTTAQNQWLHLNKGNLKNRKILYLRCDATYLYDFWNEALIGNVSESLVPLSDILPTINDYFDFLLLAKIAKSEPDGFGNCILNDLTSENIQFPYKEDRAEESAQRVSKSISWYLRDHVRLRLEHDEKYVRHLFFDKPSKRREYFRWIDCAKALKVWMNISDYKLLKFLDGVDNLHLNTDEGTELYDRFLPELRSFILRAASSNEIRVGVMRNRTYIDIMKRDPVTLSSTDIVDPKYIRHYPPNTKKVIKKRIDWLRSDARFEECATTIEASIEILPDNEIIHDNIRTLIGSATSLAEHVRFRYRQLGGQADLKHQASVQVNRNLFLNGRFHLATQNEFTRMNREKGLPYINPFWFDDDVSYAQEPDILLLRIRMLEFLKNGDMQEEHLKTCLKGAFRYDLSHIEQALKDARAFGWIDSKSEKKGSSHIIYELSRTGKFLLMDLLADVDVLYMLALDTRLPHKLFEDGLIAVHTNHVYHRSGYIGAAVVTVIAFTRYLSEVIQYDLSNATLSVNGQYSQEFLSPSAIARLATHLDKILDGASEEDWELILSKYRFFDI
jgi:hypothetical protein